MRYVDVTSQVELDAALKAGDYPTLRGEAEYEIYGSAQVRACDTAQVRAFKFVAVTSHGIKVSIAGGVVIQVPELNTPELWCEFYGVDVTGGIATLYKAVSDDYISSPSWKGVYIPGTIPTAPDWDGGKRECGGGLHFSPRPFMAVQFN